MGDLQPKIPDYLPRPGGVVARKPGKPWAGVEGFRVTAYKIDMKHPFFCFCPKGNMYHMLNDDVEFSFDF